MAWVIGEKKDLEKIISYLLENESECIQALSLYISNDTYKFPKKHNVITLINLYNNTISGIIIITSKGLIYPKFNQHTLYNENEKKQLIKLFAKINVRIHGVIGLDEDVNFMDSVIFRRIKGKNDYILMSRETHEKFKPMSGYKIRKASIFDLNRLAPLEIEYQKEEVLLSPKDLNRPATVENFRRKIISNDIYFLTENSFPLAKAGTSYRSKNYTLIGGVFTWKERRNSGLSTILLKHLLNEQLTKGYKGALFVKTENLAAIHLYEKLGFINPRSYTINYYYK